MDPGGTAVSLSSTHAGSSAAVEPVEPPLNCFKFLQQQFAVSHPQSSSVDCLQCFDAVGWVAGKASGL